MKMRLKINIRLCVYLLCGLLTVSSCRRHSKQNRGGKSRSERLTRSSDRSAHNVKLSGSEIFKKYNKAVFMIFTSDGIDGKQGSGFFIDSNGLAVSNYHVFQGTDKGLEQIKLANSDVAYKVEKVIYYDAENDFIVFQTNCKSTCFIPIAQKRPSIGEKVFAIGSPKGLENTFSSGEVSQWRGDNIIQTSVSIDHGSSGGALINEYGEVIGITSGTFDEESSANLNVAVSIEVVKPYI